MPRSKEQNAVLRDERKQKILSEALRLFAIRGFDNVTIDDITKACECSHGLFYHYFRNRNDVLKAVLKWRDETYPEYVMPIHEALALEGIRGLKLIADYCIKISKAPIEMLYFSRLTSISRYASKQAPKKLFNEDVFASICTLINQAMQREEIRKGKVEEIALLFFDFVSGATYRRLYERDNIDVSLSSETIMRIFR